MMTLDDTLVTLADQYKCLKTLYINDAFVNTLTKPFSTLLLFNAPVQCFLAMHESATRLLKILTVKNSSRLQTILLSDWLIS